MGRSGDGKRNNLLGWPQSKAGLLWVDATPRDALDVGKSRQELQQMYRACGPYNSDSDKIIVFKKVLKLWKLMYKKNCLRL